MLGLTDQTDLFFTSSNALALNTDLSALSAGAAVTLDQATVAPGADFTATGSGLAADWRAAGEVGTEASGDPLGVADVIDGQAVFTGTAPSEPGEYSVTLTGAQTGASVSATLTVTAEAIPASPSPTPTPTATAPAVALPGSGPSTGAAAAVVGALASTGAQVAPVAGLAALLLAAGGVFLVIRRRRHHAAS